MRLLIGFVQGSHISLKSHSPPGVNPVVFFNYNSGSLLHTSQTDDLTQSDAASQAITFSTNQVAAQTNKLSGAGHFPRAMDSARTCPYLAEGVNIRERKRTRYLDRVAVLLVLSVHRSSPPDLHSSIVR